mgnify:FL=1|jgi:hypothetical protein
MITYTWTIENVIVTPSVTIGSDTFTDVVNKIKWRCSGTEGSNTAYEEQTWPVAFENAGGFTALDALDVDTVISWIMGEADKDNQLRRVAAKIEIIKNTKSIG